MKESSAIYHETMQEYPDISLMDFGGNNSRSLKENHPDEMFRLQGYSNMKTNKIQSYLHELPINNHLKTCEEIEVEFLFIMSSHKNILDEKESNRDTYGRIIKKTEAHIAIHNLDNILSGPMEENY